MPACRDCRWFRQGETDEQREALQQYNLAGCAWTAAHPHLVPVPLQDRHEYLIRANAEHPYCPGYEFQGECP